MRSLIDFSGATSAVLEKEVHYLSRSGPTLFTLVMPVVVLLIFRLSPGKSDSAGGLLGHAADLAFPLGAAYTLLILTNLVYNSFGADADTVVHMVTGMTGSGIRLSAAEMPDPNNKLAPVDTFMDKLKQRLGAGAVLSDVSRDQNGNTNAVSFALAAHGRGFYFRVIRADRSQYILLVQFPESQRDTATELKEAFFSSFSFARP